MKIGIFGGSFNPPHQMHKQIALDLLEKGYVDKVIYVPTGNLYPKEELVSDIDRYQMIKKMITGYLNLEVSDYEFGIRTFTYQTLDHFQKQYPSDEIYFICGTDNFKQLNTWKKYPYILENYKMIVIIREKEDIPSLLQSYPEYQENIIVTRIVTTDLSSTKVRKLLKLKKYNEIVGQVDEKVLEYIKEKNLYKEK